MSIASRLEGAVGRPATPPRRDSDDILQGRPSRITPRRVERLLVFFLPLGAYLMIGWLLAIRYHSYVGDAQSRLANAYYVLFSRDPHLAAIGFVWNPLTSLVELPLLLFKPIFPALATEAFAANIVSSLAMAGAAYHVYRFFEDLRLRRLARWGLLACFAANPMIIFFGANGMSEALFTLTLVVAARYLAKWLRNGGLRPLVTSGFMLGWAYLARNEAVAAAAAGTVVVLGATYLRTDGVHRTRRMAALTDGVLFVTPSLVAFAGWAIVSWVIVGHPFEQYSSAYGTSSQLRLLGAGAASATSGALVHFRYVVKALLSMAPLLPVILLLAVPRAWRNRDPSIVALGAILGAVCAFEVAAYTLGQISWAYRYVIYTVAFSVMAAGCVASPARAGAAEPFPDAPPLPRRWLLLARGRTWDLGAALAASLAFLLLVPGVITTGHTMLATTVDGPDQTQLNWILWPGSKAARGNPRQYNWVAVRAEARRLDALHLPHGAIMLDNFEPCVPQLLLLSKHPKQFSIPNDQDFKERLGAPYQTGVRYFFVPPPVGYGSVDALNVEYPSLYANGDGLATLAGQVQMPDCPTFRLYKLIPESS